MNFDRIVEAVLLPVKLNNDLVLSAESLLGITNVALAWNAPTIDYVSVE